MNTEFVWTVDDFCDSLKRRKRAHVESEAKYRTIHSFDSEFEAAAFMSDRAEQRLGRARKELKSAEQRARKCRERLERVSR